MMKNFHFTFLFLLPFALSAYDIQDIYNPDNKDRQLYIETYRYIAVEEMERTGVPASIKLAQGVLESGDGKSVLAKKANNHFGMKCGGAWKGKTFYRKDDDYDDKGRLIESCFRAYGKAEESYRAHSDFLTDPRKEYRYGFLFDIPVTDYEAWAKGLKKSGYATNPNYANLLIGIIEANQLNQYDFMSIVDMELKFTKAIKKESIAYTNDVKMIYAEEGQKLSAIASKYDVKLDRLMKYNELSSGSTAFEKGDRVYLQRKRKSYRGKNKYHIVKEGDSMYAIAQQYGVRLDKLYKKNRMFEKTEPAIGAKISLRKKVKKDAIPRLRSQKDQRIPSFTLPLKVFVTNLFAEISITEPVDDGQKPTATTSSYAVQKGDTLYSISRKFNLSIEQLKVMNGLKDNALSIGQILKLD